MLATLDPAALEDPSEGSADRQNAVLSCGNFMPHARVAAAASVPLLKLSVLDVEEGLGGIQSGPVFFQSAELQRWKLDVSGLRILTEHNDQLHAQLVVWKNYDLHRDWDFLLVPGLADELQSLLVLLGQHAKNYYGDVAFMEYSDMHAGRVFL